MPNYHATQLINDALEFGLADEAIMEMTERVMAEHGWRDDQMCEEVEDES